MAKFDAVLFDWSGTLVHDPPLRERVRIAFAAIGRDDPIGVETICLALEACEGDLDIVAAQATADTSSAKYVEAELLHFERAGIDGELAGSLIKVDEWPASRPLYPDALETLRRIKNAGVFVSVLSDIHFDIRPLLTAQGAGSYIDDYVLSFEHGIQKPDPRIFETALTRLGINAERALMVGDRSTHDGAAAECGIATLVLPRVEKVSHRQLSLVTSLVTSQ